MPDKPEKQDLIVTLDNATGQITSIFLTDHGGQVRPPARASGSVKSQA